jgi:hypothetical protein
LKVKFEIGTVSKRNIITNIIIALLMAGISVWMAKTDLVFGQIATVFFGSIALLLVVKHFKNTARDNNIKLNQPASKAPASNQPAELSKEIFTFNGDNFTIQIEQEIRSVS